MTDTDYGVPTPRADAAGPAGFPGQPADAMADTGHGVGADAAARGHAPPGLGRRGGLGGEVEEGAAPAHPPLELAQHAAPPERTASGRAYSHDAERSPAPGTAAEQPERADAEGKIHRADPKFAS
jgi:hypothetical protein